MTRNDSGDSDDGLLFPRRSLLKGAAAATVLSAMPWSLRQAFARQDFDLVVIGGGTAGIPAAIFAADRGARVVIVEKASAVGGTLFVSGGMIAGANTVFQKAKGSRTRPTRITRTSCASTTIRQTPC